MSVSAHTLTRLRGILDDVKEEGRTFTKAEREELSDCAKALFTAEVSELVFRLCRDIDRREELMFEAQFKDTPRYMQFLAEMRAAGYEVRVYSARGMEGRVCPAVTCERSELQSLIRASSLNLSHDTLGRDYIVYVR